MEEESTLAHSCVIQDVMVGGKVSIEARGSWSQCICCQEVETDEHWSSAHFLQFIWDPSPQNGATYNFTVSLYPV